MLLLCSPLEEVSVRTPGIVLSSSSRMSVTVVSMTLALAPRRNTDTDTTGGSTSGSSRTERRVKLMAPNRTSAADTMAVSTGRRIEVSESINATSSA